MSEAVDCIQTDMADVENGTAPWDGPRKLSDLMTFDQANDSLKTLFEEYHLHLFCINEQSGFTVFHSDLKQLFQTMNCRKDKQKLAELVKDKVYSHLSEETWDAIAVMTDNATMIRKKDLYKTENNEKEEYNMCQALEELMADSRNEGERIGEERGKRIGEKRGEKKGDLSRTQIVVQNMLARGFETEDICAIAECDLELIEKMRKSLL